MTEDDKASFRRIAIFANAAYRDLSGKAADGAKARPTVAQLNRTLERLLDIRSEATAALSSTLHDALISNNGGSGDR